MLKKQTLETKIAIRISQKKELVLLRKDFKDLGDYDQVGRALRNLVRQGVIAKVGYGLYAKTKLSPISGKRILTDSLPRIAEKALKRLNVKTRPASIQKEYNAGRTTQVPTGRLIGVESRISRKISYEGKQISFERYTK